MHFNRDINKLCTGHSIEGLLTRLNLRSTNNIILGNFTAHYIDTVNPQSALEDTFSASNMDKGNKPFASLFSAIALLRCNCLLLSLVEFSILHDLDGTTKLSRYNISLSSSQINYIEKTFKINLVRALKGHSSQVFHC